ncbi:MAG: AAA family ATPase [Bacilli bacterium]|nr:AAA family ATPase [Bacilli bacterium]
MDSLTFIEESNKNAVLIGPNGSGKTTLANNIKHATEGSKVFTFSADRILIYNKGGLNYGDYETFRQRFDVEQNDANDVTSSNRPHVVSNIFNEAVRLFEYRRSDENEGNEPTKKCQLIMDEWHKLVPGRSLVLDHGNLTAKTDGGEYYSIQFLSSGEKSILYFLIMTLLQPEMEYFFVDEPENNLNPAIVSELWDFIERECPKATFVYLTHNSDFAVSRVDANAYWIQNYDGRKWSYQELPSSETLPRELTIQLLGTRKPILFCESNGPDGLDAQLYRIMFPEYRIVPACGCDMVKRYVKGYCDCKMPQKAIGIIDRDYKTQDELSNLEARKEGKIYHLPCIEIENLYVSEEILKAMIDKGDAEDSSSLFDSLLTKARELFRKNKERWVAKKTYSELLNEPNRFGSMNRLKSIDELKENYRNSSLTDQQIDSVASKYYAEANAIEKSSDFNRIVFEIDLKKGLLLYFGSELGLKTTYGNDVLSFLKSPEGAKLVTNLKNKYFSGI